MTSFVIVFTLRQLTIKGLHADCKDVQVQRAEMKLKILHTTSRFRSQVTLF